MNEIKVSVVVPVYKTGPLLKRSVDSLRRQTLKEMEIILVDDGSPDDSGDLCDAFAKEDPRIRVIHKENGGVSSARNEGIRAAKGKYLGFVDSDDEVEEEMFFDLFTAAEEESADLVLSGMILVDGNMFQGKGEEVRNPFPEKQIFATREEKNRLLFGIVGARPECPFDSQYGTGVWRGLFLRERIQKENLIFLDQRKYLSEDALFLLDFVASAEKAVGLPKAYYRYFRNENSLSKGYDPKAVEKALFFLSEMEKRLRLAAPEEEWRLYLDRITLAFARVLTVGEILREKEAGQTKKETKKRLLALRKEERIKAAFRSYPLFKLPKKQALFAFAIRHRLIFFLRLFVSLREKQ